MSESTVQRLVWFRNDLRLSDNPALWNACQTDTETKISVTAIYIICAEFFTSHMTAPARIDFIKRHLMGLQESLSTLNIALKVIKVEKAVEIPAVFSRLADENNISELYFNAEYPFDEFERDKSVAFVLREKNIRVKRFHDRVIIPPGMVRNQQGDAYKIFTPFKRNWIQQAKSLNLTPLSKPKKLPENNFHTEFQTSTADIEKLFRVFPQRDLSAYWPSGENAAQTLFKDFLEHSIIDYHKTRDYPALEGTSRLSPYLAIGSISPRQVLCGALALNHGEWDTGQEGITCWINEIIWREFYQHVMVDFPQVCKFKPMQMHTEFFPWKHDKNLFNAWCEGKTGIPIVDAAMRQLRETGWMHNRLRMVVAMFFTKNLQMDWRMGESYFMSQLIDGDFAANNGGWQWCASTGTDAAPYFRIFNPISQSEKFDAQGDFIRRYVPELKHLSAKQIHCPGLVDNYPLPIVDLSESRKETIAIFSNIKSGG